jgi:exopolysaccharide biosynthesis polyprenyl glycosylphosphotransferase
MNRFRRQEFVKAMELFDFMIVAFSMAVAALLDYFLNANISPLRFLSMHLTIRNLFILPAFMAGGHLSFSLFGLYQSKRLSTLRSEIIDILQATALGALVIFVVRLFFGFALITPIFAVVFWWVSSSLMILSRLVLRFVLAQIRTRGRNLRNALIVGTNDRAVQFALKILGNRELGYRIIGFVDNEWSGTPWFQKTGFLLTADFAGFPAYLRENVVDEVFIDLPIKSCYDLCSQIISQCEEQGITVRYISSLFNPKLGRYRADEMEDDSLITFSTGVMTGPLMVLKRTLDFVLSFFLLLLASPVFLITALLVKLTSSGPVFFVQKRLGLNKRLFPLYKFRTMVPDAESRLCKLEHLNEMKGPVFKIKNDPRITRPGKFLRRTSIDELPQLLNVLRGDMSLVGPRPLPVRDYNGFDKDWQRRRFSVRPGITCLWQINGRNTVSFEHWMEEDMEYIDHWSLWLDFKIMAKTIPVVLRGSGAA